jgi:endoglucanase
MNKSMFFFLVLLLMPSCSSDDTPPAPEVIVSLETITFSNAGETKPFYVKSNVNWEVTSSETWCALSMTNGEVGTMKVDVTASSNPTATTRTANISVKAGSISKQVTVTQQASVILTLSKDSFQADPNGDEIIITVESSGDYEMTTDADWIIPISDSKFTVPLNRSLFARSATITYSLGDLVKTVAVSQSGQPLTIPANDNGVSSNAMTLAQKIKVGWNLGNTLEATGVSNGVYSAGETLWGNPKTSKTLIDAVKAAGFNAVRLPCAWSGYIEDNETYRIKESWLARVKEVVDYCVDNDMYVIVNIHWDGGWLEEHPLYASQEDVNKKQKALWEQISVYFRDYDEHLLFAGTNEVHANYNTPSSENIAVQQSFNQTFVDAVRSTGGKNTWRNIVVQSYNTNISYASDYMTMPSDAEGVVDRLMAEVHFYDPYDFTLDATSSIYLWGSEFTGSPNESNWGQEAWVDEAFGIVKTKFVDNNIPVILGEYGATLRSTLSPSAYADHIKSRNHYLNYINQKAKDNGIIPFYWDNGATGNNGSGLFNRATGEQVHSDAIESITSVFN